MHTCVSHESKTESKQHSGAHICYTCAGVGASGAILPAVRVTLGYVNETGGKVSYTQLCNSSIDLSQLPPSTSDDHVFIRVTAGLFQNFFQGCIQDLDQITTIGFQPTSQSITSSSPISFCLDNITLASPTLQTSE